MQGGASSGTEGGRNLGAAAAPAMSCATALSVMKG